MAGEHISRSAGDANSTALTLRSFAIRSLKIPTVAGAAGLSLIEILVAGFIISMAAVGLSLMFGTGNTWVAAMGQDRVADGLAQQRIEGFRSDTIRLGWDSASSTVVPGTVTEASVDPANCDITQEKCRLTPKYLRVSCIQYVDDTDITSPAYTPGCPAGSPTNTRRITVTVTPVFVDATLASNSVERAYVVTLQGCITESGK